MLFLRTFSAVTGALLVHPSKETERNEGGEGLGWWQRDRVPDLGEVTGCSERDDLWFLLQPSVGFPWDSGVTGVSQQELSGCHGSDLS